MPIKIAVDCVHNAGRIVVSSSRRPDMSFGIAKAVCEIFSEDSGFYVYMPESECVKKYGMDSIRGRVSIANAEPADCYLCIHSNPSGRHRECGVAAHIKPGDEFAAKLANKILSEISVITNLNPLGIYENNNAFMLREASVTPVVLEVAFNPYNESYTPFRNAVTKLPEAIRSGIRSVFEEGEGEPQDFQDYLNQNPGNGFMKVQVLAGRSLVPVPESKIFITKRLNGEKFTLADAKSDMNGMTEPISLPAPPASFSQTPGGTTPFAVYDVEVSNPGYISHIEENVPVFDGILSIQTIRLNADSI